MLYLQAAKLDFIFKLTTFMPTSISKDKHFSFFQNVWDVTRLIPRGRVTSYGAIARYLGLKSSARMVGWALNQAAGAQDVPAHRVVNRNGLLSGKMHFATPERMQELLEQEGIQVMEDQVIDFDRLFWDPSGELETDFR